MIKIGTHICHTPAWYLLPIAEVTIMENFPDFWKGCDRTHRGDMVIWKEDVYGKVMGFLSFRPYEDQKEMWIIMAYVKPEYRRQGLHKAMFDRLVEYCTEKGFFAINSGAAWTNSASIESQKKRGSLLGVSSVFHIPQKE